MNYKQEWEYTPFSESIDTLIQTNNEEICWKVTCIKKSVSTREKNWNLLEWENYYFQETKKKREKLSGFVMLSEVLPISHETDMKWLYN